MSAVCLAVVGGVNLDVLGMPDGPVQPHDSLIGRVTFACGGVGHNIAAQAVRAGAQVDLFTVFGDDRHADWLRSRCQEEGIGLSRAVTLPGSSPVYLAIHRQDGDMLYAVNDMALMSGLSPSVIRDMLPVICQADAVVADANLTEEALNTLARGCSAPLICDPVSIEKAGRVHALLPALTAIKPNWLEARALTGADTPEQCAELLLSRGVQMVFVSLGSEGLYYADRQERGHLRPTAISRHPQTGAGDALTAGIAVGVGRHLSAKACAELGMVQAARHLHISSYERSTP